MADNFFLRRLADLKRAFIAGRDTANQAKPATGGNDKGVTKRNGKKAKYVRHDAIEVKVFAYQNPQALQRVDLNAKWYQEHKVVETGKDWIIALVGGHRVRYTIQVYTFHGVKNDDKKLQELFSYILKNKNPKRRYSGWVHHANVYYQVTGIFIKQIPLNYYL